MTDLPAPPTTLAAVLHFDETTEQCVREAWAALEDHGIASAASTYTTDYRPHVTLAIVDTPDAARLTPRLRRLLDDAAGLRLTMTGLGFFLTGRAPAYLVVSPTTELLTLHARVHRTIERTTGPARSWSYYRPGSWIPHCTLAMGVGCQSSVAEALAGVSLPVSGTVSSAELVALPAPVEVSPAP